MLLSFRSEDEDWPPCLAVFSLCRASASRFNSFVLNCGHMLALNVRSNLPTIVVSLSRMASVTSLCMRSFASPCQCAKWKSSWSIAELCGSGRSPSNTGIEHYSMSPCQLHAWQMNISLWRQPGENLQSSRLPIAWAPKYLLKIAWWCHDQRSVLDGTWHHDRKGCCSKFKRNSNSRHTFCQIHASGFHGQIPTSGEGGPATLSKHPARSHALNQRETLEIN